MPNSHLNKLLKKQMTRKEFLGLSVFALASVFGIVGILEELRSHAATPFFSEEAESGTITAPATIVTDTTASGGKTVKFGLTNSMSLAPLLSPAVNGSGAMLRTVGSSKRLKLKGVNVWGIPDAVTNNGTFAIDQYNNRVAICNRIAGWGGNLIRLRAYASEWNNLSYNSSQADILQKIKDWRDAAKNAGIYLMICWWDSQNSSGPGAPPDDQYWATPYGYTYPFAMMTAVYNALKLADGSDDPWVFYEPCNEPNSITDAQWLVAMEATVQHFRTIGYQGLLVCGMMEWSHNLDEPYGTQLEAYDATLTKSAQPNIAFAYHLYPVDMNYTFSGSSWLLNMSPYSNGSHIWNGQGIPPSSHLILCTECGYDSAEGDSASFSAAETSYWKTNMFDQTNIAGAASFLFGPWTDANTMSTDITGGSLTGWGSDVVNWLSSGTA